MLNERLRLVSDYIIGNTLVDIGSDHAYLPIYAIENGLCQSAICGEVVEGPFDSSVKNVKEKNMDDKIEVRFGDGLKILNESDQVDTITICGMGGPLIASIIETGFKNVSGKPRIIAQANTYPYKVRQVMSRLNYQVSDERQYKDGPHFYDIIVFDYCPDKPSYSERELRFGPLNLVRRTDLFIDDLKREKQHIEKILLGIKETEQNKGKITELKKELQVLNEVIDHDHS
ncbi:tRNA (adenine(22)-N(1))-methyltransferase TrmK [Jeotgalicoccus sp. S0W5]|uniref:tRNA (adenine(22)-N(1))-methyltransferase n=1 Tax=Jeotgalicoccus sp. S0W5 TaxID=2527874 RepID=UPI001414D989|nr:tRNA (adenine(22)-N(1))-methyltransferase TrmK [Jeotgalicoccus sp. S0W5]